MPSLKDIKLRIATVKNTQQITKAMKMVSAAKLRRSQDALVEARPYANRLQNIVSNIASGVDFMDHPLFTPRKGGKTVVLMITTDKGLCGSLNNNLSKEIFNYIRNNEEGAESFSLIVFGRKGLDFFSKTDLPVEEKYTDLRPEGYAEKLEELTDRLVQQYMDQKINRVYVVYNKFINVLRQEITLQSLLPITPPKLDVSKKILSRSPIFEPSGEAVMNGILPKYLQNLSYLTLLENNASEHGSRMRIMDSATNNAGDLIDRLTLQFNRLRQAVITKELIEIISGAESIN